LRNNFTVIIPETKASEKCVEIGSAENDLVRVKCADEPGHAIHDIVFLFLFAKPSELGPQNSASSPFRLRTSSTSTYL
jgi:hypothetical protein